MKTKIVEYAEQVPPVNVPGQVVRSQNGVVCLVSFTDLTAGALSDFYRGKVILLTDLETGEIFTGEKAGSRPVYEPKGGVLQLERV